METEFKNDARSRKTRHAIKYALMKLLRTKEIGQITVKELTETSQRNRNSFYTHYRTCFDVLLDISNDFIKYVEDILDKYTFYEFFKNPSCLIGEITKVILQHQTSSSMYLFACLTADMRSRTTASLSEYIFERYKNETGAVNSTTRYIISFIVTGIMDMYLNWFNIGGVELEELSNALSMLLKNGSFILRRVTSATENSKIKNDDTKTDKNKED